MAVWLLFVCVIIWLAFTQTQPVLPKPESARALEYFCTGRLTPEVRP